MIPTVTFDPVMRSIEHGPCTADQLWQDHAHLWRQLGWNASQIKLWLGCLPDVCISVTATGEKAYRLECKQKTGEQCLADHIVALLDKVSKPMPLSHLLKKLPAGLVVSEPMLRAAASADARLELKGPLVKLV